MKSLFIVLSFLSLAAFGSSEVAHAENVTGHLTVTYNPRFGGGGVLETDLRQVGNQILGQSSMGLRMINLTVANGSYSGVVGSNPTQLKCSTTNCSGFIDGQGTNLNISTKQKGNTTFIETAGTVNNQVYTADSSSSTLSISTWNTMDLTKGTDGSYSGEMTVGMRTYDVSVSLDGSMANFMNDPALVAIFLGAPIAHH